MDRIDKNNIQAVNGRDETDESSPDYALSLIIDSGEVNSLLSLKARSQINAVANSCMAVNSASDILMLFIVGILLFIY